MHSMTENQNYIEKLWLLTERTKVQSPFLVPVHRGTEIIPADILPKEKHTLELGPGWGEVALELASSQPDTGFFLVEKKINRVRHILKEIERRNLENIRILILNFNWFFSEVLCGNSFDEILMNFPDPWPKTRHKKHRSFDKSFLEGILHLLKMGGNFYFATDHGSYGRDTIRILRNAEFKERLSHQFSLERSTFPISYFENIQKRQGRRIYYISFRKMGIESVENKYSQTGHEI